MSAPAAALAIMVALSLPVLPIDGTVDSEYVRQQEFISPISGERFVASVLVGEPPVLSFDYDRCPHSEINALDYALVIDPSTGYVGYADEFYLPTQWDAEDIQLIVGEPKFSRATPSGLPWAGAFPWEKYENAARIAQAGDAPLTVIANYWLKAAWSVRLDFVSGPNDFRQEADNLLASMPLVKPDISDLLTLYEVQLCRHWEELRSSGQISEERSLEIARALAWLYRSRGELVAAEHWLRMSTMSDEPLADGGLLYQYMLSSIQLERSYFRITKDMLHSAWDEGSITAASQGGMAFQLGEINRRLGDFPSAAYWYTKAIETNRGALNRGLIERQLALVVEGRGY